MLTVCKNRPGGEVSSREEQLLFYLSNRVAAPVLFAQKNQRRDVKSGKLATGKVWCLKGNFAFFLYINTHISCGNLS